MLVFRSRRGAEALPKLFGRSLVSCIFVILTHLALSTVPRLFTTRSPLTLLPLSALVLVLLAGLGKFCRRLLGIYASAPAMVFFNILFVWAFYVAIVRKAVSPLMDLITNAELGMLVTGLCCMLSSDPGLVKQISSDVEKFSEDSGLELEDDGKELELLTGEGFVLGRRIRYCKSCQAYVKGFDHHCPAFGNCIGQKNYVLFMLLLVGFVASESSYLVCCFQYAAETSILDSNNVHKNSLSRNLVISTMQFSILQVLWQGVFLAWHIYCVCINIKTDEWINWKNYPEFQFVSQPEPGQPFTMVRFRNPYDKGVLLNIRESLAPE